MFFKNAKLLNFTVAVQNCAHIFEQCINNNPELYTTGEKIRTS